MKIQEKETSSIYCLPFFPTVTWSMKRNRHGDEPMRTVVMSSLLSEKLMVRTPLTITPMDHDIAGMVINSIQAKIWENISCNGIQIPNTRSPVDASAQAVKLPLCERQKFV